MVETLTSELFNEIVNLLLDTAIIFIIAYFFSRILSFILIRTTEYLGHARIAVKMVIPIINVIIYAAAIFFAIERIVSLSTIELVALSGLFGAGIGFGLKDIFGNIMGGVIIAFQKPFRIGDRITMGSDYGEVTDIGLMETQIITPDDNLVTIPNSKIFTQNVACANAGKTEMMVVIDIYIDHNADISRAVQIFTDAVITSSYIYMSNSCNFIILTENQLHSVRLRARAYVWDLRDEFRCKAEISKRTKEAFQREGIIPPRFYLPGELPVS
jgi:small-conductance mechanosensitive channel